MTTSDDGTARLWDAATEAPIGQPMRHDAEVHSAVFSPDGARVLTASVDQTARLWDAATGALIGKPMWHDDGVTNATFSPDGRLVETVSAGQTARVWRAPPLAPNIIATACRMLGGNHDVTDFRTRYGISVTDPICGPNTPPPNPKLMSDKSLRPSGSVHDRGCHPIS